MKKIDMDELDGFINTLNENPQSAALEHYVLDDIPTDKIGALVDALGNAAAKDVYIRIDSLALIPAMTARIKQSLRQPKVLDETILKQTQLLFATCTHLCDPELVDEVTQHFCKSAQTANSFQSIQRVTATLLQWQVLIMKSANHSLASLAKIFSDAWKQLYEKLAELSTDKYKLERIFVNQQRKYFIKIGGEDSDTSLDTQLVTDIKKWQEGYKKDTFYKKLGPEISNCKFVGVGQDIVPTLEDLTCAVSSSTEREALYTLINNAFKQNDLTQLSKIIKDSFALNEFGILDILYRELPEQVKAAILPAEDAAPIACIAGLSPQQGAWLLTLFPAEQLQALQLPSDTTDTCLKALFIYFFRQDNQESLRQFLGKLDSYQRSSIRSYLLSNNFSLLHVETDEDKVRIVTNSLYHSSNERQELMTSGSIWMLDNALLRDDINTQVLLTAWPTLNRVQRKMLKAQILIHFKNTEVPDDLLANADWLYGEVFVGLTEHKSLLSLAIFKLSAGVLWYDLVGCNYLQEPTSSTSDNADLKSVMEASKRTQRVMEASKRTLARAQMVLQRINDRKAGIVRTKLTRTDLFELMQHFITVYKASDEDLKVAFKNLFMVNDPKTISEWLQQVLYYDSRLQPTQVLSSGHMLGLGRDDVYDCGDWDDHKYFQLLNLLLRNVFSADDITHLVQHPTWGALCFMAVLRTPQTPENLTRYFYSGQKNYEFKNTIENYFFGRYKFKVFSPKVFLKGFAEIDLKNAVWIFDEIVLKVVAAEKITLTSNGAPLLFKVCTLSNEKPLLGEFAQQDWFCNTWYTYDDDVLIATKDQIHVMALLHYTISPGNTERTQSNALDHKCFVYRCIAQRVETTCKNRAEDWQQQLAKKAGYCANNFEMLRTASDEDLSSMLTVFIESNDIANLFALLTINHHKITKALVDGLSNELICLLLHHYSAVANKPQQAKKIFQEIFENCSIFTINRLHELLQLDAWPDIGKFKIESQWPQTFAAILSELSPNATIVKMLALQVRFEELQQYEKSNMTGTLKSSPNSSDVFNAKLKLQDEYYNVCRDGGEDAKNLHSNVGLMTIGHVNIYGTMLSWLHSYSTPDQRLAADQSRSFAFC